MYGGVGAGLLASVAVGLLFTWGLTISGSANQTYAPVLKPMLEGVFSVVAIAMLSWMLIWMTQQSRLLKNRLKEQLAQPWQTRQPDGEFLANLFAVLREGFETVLFIAAKFQQGSGSYSWRSRALSLLLALAYCCFSLA